MNYAEHRSTLVNWIRSQLIGPWSKAEPLRGMSPTQRYPVGVLFPTGLGDGGIDAASEDMEDEASEEPISDETNNKETAEPTQSKRRYVPPSAVGFSFFIRGAPIELQVQCSATRYHHISERDESGRFAGERWEREMLPEVETEVELFAPPSQIGQIAPSRDTKPVFGERAEIDVLWRPFSDGWLATISLVNRQEVANHGSLKDLLKERSEKALFETHLRCTINAGEVGTYPRVDRSLLDAEEQELELQYKHRRIHAIGHGAAADWQLSDGRVTDIWTEFLPEVEVPQVTADVAKPGTEILSLLYLADFEENRSRICDDLERFVLDYADWVTDRKAAAEALPAEEKAVAGRIIDRMDTAVGRMRQGIALLREDADSVRAFALANRAMLNQMAQLDRCRGKPVDESHYRWRPFQLAFLLTVLESAVKEDSEFRDTVDLIWFPTGGGKTEAYLGLIAFLIVRRRLTHQTSGDGTAILMRYTLRLLTAQQYLRATRLICALEQLRRERPELGGEPITIGMWVGETTSPNSHAKALETVQRAAEGDGRPPRNLVLERCPWCETSFKAPDSFSIEDLRFRFRCINPSCDFGASSNGELPCNVVDEALYSAPPTLLIATIDKFARLAWEERTSAFFGGRKNRPPELIIQDELHLIAGALGSIAGLYEAALDTVLIERGIQPKYIASTATIRMAQIQTRRLYGREVAVFPPPGLSCDDAYFARTVPMDQRPGRLYVGYLTYSLPRPEWMAPLVAALLAAPEIVFGVDQIDRDALLEAWWTQVVYHGSLKGVGNSHTAFTTAVREWFDRFAQEVEESRQEAADDEARPGPRVQRPHAQIAQLTSISSAEENARTFTRLERPRTDPDCLDAVLATNMVSVGLDVARLAVMVINGQPLTTAEYIQASSRVGRGEVPGLVFAHYYRNQARSLSHYENFRPYHESFYRFVEPTSITPFTFQARMRALHAALVIAIRHSAGVLVANGSAGDFDPENPRIAKVIHTLTRRCCQAAPEAAIQIEDHLRQLVFAWRSEAERCRLSKRQLDYSSAANTTNSDRLLYGHDDKIKGLWTTLHSMRNVEKSALLKPL